MKENVHDGYLRVSLQLTHFHDRLLAFEYADIPPAFGKGWCGSARFLFPPDMAWHFFRPFRSLMDNLIDKACGRYA